MMRSVLHNIFFIIFAKKMKSQLKDTFTFFVSFFLITLLILSCDFSKKTKQKDIDITPSLSSFLMGKFLIDTVNQVVFHKVYFEEDIVYKNKIDHQKGYKYVIDTQINFNTTCLYVTDTRLTFKEYYDPTVDIDAYYKEDNSSSTNANDINLPGFKELGMDWLCDGKYLTHKDCLNPDEDNLLSNTTPDSYVPVADISKLQFVKNIFSSKLLVDGVNFYLLDGSRIMVISIEDLWFEVEIMASDYIYADDKF